MKRENGIWYINAVMYNIVDGKLVKTSNWLPAGTIERAIVMIGGGHAR
jgi:hypothetical protein